MTFVYGITGGSTVIEGDIALSIREAGLDEYWGRGIRDLFQNEREQALFYMADNYSIDELIEQYLAYRSCLLAEFHVLTLLADLQTGNLLAKTSTNSSKNTTPNGFPCCRNTRRSTRDFVI